MVVVVVVVSCRHDHDVGFVVGGGFVYDVVMIVFGCC